jgi:hypothetical protein
MNAAVQLNGQPMLETVKIQHTIFDRKLAAEFRSQPTIAQEPPRDLFRFRRRPSQFANSWRGDPHGAIISVLLELGRAQAPAPETPHPTSSVGHLLPWEKEGLPHRVFKHSLMTSFR